MKKKQLITIAYKIPIDEVLDQINSSLPVKITNADFLEQIHQKYPMLLKSDISLITRSFFEVLRESLLRGEVVNFNKTFSNMHLKFYTYQKHNKTYLSIKVKISTPVGVK